MLLLWDITVGIQLQGHMMVCHSFRDVNFTITKNKGSVYWVNLKDKVYQPRWWTMYFLVLTFSLIKEFPLLIFLLFVRCSSILAIHGYIHSRYSWIMFLTNCMFYIFLSCTTRYIFEGKESKKTDPKNKLVKGAKSSKGEKVPQENIIARLQVPFRTVL